MNVLKTARRQAGIQVAIFWVFLPLLAVGAVVLFSLIFVGYSEKNHWLVSVLMDVDAAILFAPIVAYFIARRNPKLVRKQLKEMLHIEKLILSKHETTLAEWLQKLKDVDNDHRAFFETLWTKGTEQAKEDMTLRVKKMMDSLWEIDKQATSGSKIRNQEKFLRLHQKLRESEEFLKSLEGMGNFPASEEDYREFARATERGLGELKNLLQKYAGGWKIKIAESRQIISEIQECLREI